MIHYFLAIQFFTDVDECTHNLHICAPNMKCVNEYGSFFCKGLSNTLLNNTDVVVVMFAVGDVFTVIFSWNRVASFQVHCKLLNLVSCNCQLFNDSQSMHFHLSVLNKI